MSAEIKSMKPGQRVKILSAPSEASHPLHMHIGTVQGVCKTRKNAEGSIVYKSYNVQFGNSCVQEVEARFLFSIGGE